MPNFCLYTYPLLLLQSNDLTWACDPIENQHLGSGQLQNKNTRPSAVLNLSPQYCHVILVSWYPNLTAVSRQQHGSPKSKMYAAGVWPPCCATSSFVVNRRRRRAHVPAIHAASHVDREKKRCMVFYSLHTAGAHEIWIDQSGFSLPEKLYCTVQKNCTVQ